MSDAQFVPMTHWDIEGRSLSFFVWFLFGPSILVDVGKGRIRSCACWRWPHVFCSASLLFSLLFCDLLGGWSLIFQVELVHHVG